MSKISKIDAEHMYYAAASEYSDMLLKYQRCAFIEKFKMFGYLQKAKKKYKEADKTLRLIRKETDYFY